MRRLFVSLVILVTVGAVYASAQSNPQDQPLLQSSAFAYLGSFQVPSSDGTCNEQTRQNCLSYAGYGLTLGPNNTLNVGCHDWRDQFAQISIAPVGGTASIVQRCTTVPNLSSLDPGDAGNGFTLGSVLDYNGRKIVSAWSYYDNQPWATKSHWVMSPTGTNQQGPYQVGTKGAGFVAGQMTLIPPEWRARMGGAALTGLCCPSIVGRSSYGPAMFVFDPDQVGKVEPVPTMPVLWYDEAHPLAVPTQNDLFNFTTMIRGRVWVPGTRTVVEVGKHGTGPYCYGPSAGPNKRCDSDPGNQTEHNSYHGYPYRHQVWLYDALDLEAVKNKTKQPWEVKPYAVAPLPGVPSNQGGAPNATIAGAAYNPVTRQLYLATEWGENPRIHVFAVAAPTTPTPTEICGDGLDNDKDGQIDEGCPVNCVVTEPELVLPAAAWSACSTTGEQARPETWRRRVLIPASNGGAACPTPLEEPKTGRQTCTAPAPVTSIKVAGLIAIEPVPLPGNWYLLVVVTEHGATTVQFPGLRIPGAARDLKKDDFVNWEVALNPKVP